MKFHDSAASSGFDDIFDGVTLSEPLDYRRHSLNQQSINVYKLHAELRLFPQPFVSHADVIYSNILAD